MTETLKNSKTEATKEKVKEHSLPIYQWASKLTVDSMGDEIKKIGFVTCKPFK